MITLTIYDIKSKKTIIEVIDSKDKAEIRLQSLITDPQKLEGLKKGQYLDAYSYDTTSEKALIEQFLPDDRKG